MFSASKSGQYGGYTISRSVRLRSSATAYFSRTPASAGNSQKFTYSAWVKRGVLSVQYQNILGAGNIAIGGGDATYFLSADTLAFYLDGGTGCTLITTQVFRDPSSWYHIVISVDTTQATASNRVKIYVNGSQVTAFGTATYPVQNYNFLNINKNAVVQYLGSGYTNDFDGYLTEINFIDGQALTPSSFGQYNAYGVWTPTKYNGTYGTNGFYLNFSDNSGATSTTIGKDSSGNGNNWTPNNISVTAGTTYDSMTDVPTLWGDGSTNRGNYCVLNAVSTGRTLSEGNLNYAGSSTGIVKGTIGVSSGKWYWEVTAGNGSPISNSAIGLCDINLAPTTSWLGNTSNSWSYAGSATKYNNGTGTSYGANYASGDIIGVAFDADAGTLTFYKNNVSQGQAFSGITGSVYCPAAGNNTVNDYNGYHNFGQRPFTYTPPSGYKALNTFNLPTPTISNGATVMAATLYTGTGSSQTIANTVNGVNFKPDLVWIKSRSAATDHKLTDSVRGTTKALISDTTGAETTDANGLTAFGSTGFTVGSDTTYNNNTATYVGWQWQAGQGTTSSNTSGSITSTVSVNTTAGFSVVTFTGTGAAGITVGHGLGVAPSMMIVKSRGTTGNWLVYHNSLGNTGGVALEQTAAFSANAGYWNNTSPTSTIFTLGTFTPASTAVAYCWAAIAGYSAFGSYTGNGSTDGPFVYCGFRPRFIMFKITSATGNWFIRDTSRDAYNTSTLSLYPNLSDAEFSGAAIDVLSNGFKLRASTSGANGSGESIIFAAFAENPFANALAR